MMGGQHEQKVQHSGLLTKMLDFSVDLLMGVSHLPATNQKKKLSIKGCQSSPIVTTQKYITYCHTFT